ncbi:hypothetical protein ACHQM5_010536 [Ranunculus cassubicifolius]
MDEAVKENANLVKKLPPSLKSMKEMFGLSAALSTFTSQFIDLQKHMEYIEQSIDNLYKKQRHKESQGAGVSISSTPAASMKESSGKREPFKESFQRFCKNNATKDLRRYVTVNMSDVEKLKEEATTALKCAPNPAKLILGCIGRFYVQGKKAFTKGSPMMGNRQACLLLLEFFLLIDCTNIEKSTKDEAEEAANAWRKRLITEGGLSKACKEDARGLLLLVAGYGIPSSFENQDLTELIRLSNVKEISSALQRSRALLSKIPVIIRALVKQRMGCVAVEVAYAFGLQEEFPPETILSSFLKESQQLWESSKRKSQNTPWALKEANEKQLACFETVKQCLENYKIDPSKLPGWNIDTKIANLEKVISDLNKEIKEKARTNLKRKADTSFDIPELKHTQPSNGVLPHMLPEAGGLYRSDDLLHLARQHGSGSYFGVESLAHAHNFQGVPTFENRDLLGSGIEHRYLGLAGTSVGIGIGNRNPGADLYNFADTVLDGDSHLRR